MQPLPTSPSSSSASRGSDYDGFLRVNPDRRRIPQADIPRHRYDGMVARNRFLDRSTEGRDVDFLATRGSTTRAIKRMLWSPMLEEQVWWVRQPSGRWEPNGSRERAVIRKLRVELSDAHDGRSVEEILDAMSTDDFREVAREADPNADM